VGSRLDPAAIGSMKIVVRANRSRKATGGGKEGLHDHRDEFSGPRERKAKEKKRKTPLGSRRREAGLENLPPRMENWFGKT